MLGVPNEQKKREEKKVCDEMMTENLTNVEK